MHLLQDLMWRRILKKFLVFGWTKQDPSTTSGKVINGSIATKSEHLCDPNAGLSAPPGVEAFVFWGELGFGLV